MRMSGSGLFCRIVALALPLALWQPAMGIVPPPYGATVPDFHKAPPSGAGEPAGLPPGLLSELRRQGFLVSLNRSTGAVRSVMAGRGSLTPEQTGSAAEIALAFASSHEAMLGLAPGGARALEIESSYETARNGMRHVWLIQRVDGVPVFNGRIGVHMDARGRVFAASSDETAAHLPGAVAVSVPAAQAVRTAAASIGEPYGDAGPVERSSFADRVRVFDRAHLGSSPEAEVVLYSQAGRAAPAWKVGVESRRFPASYLVMVDAASGEVLLRRNRMLYAHGTVYTSDPESSPSRAVVDFGATPESPSGWVGADNLTSGNNVHAYHDPGLWLWVVCLDGTPQDVAAPQFFQEFDYPVDLSQDPRTYVNASITSLFYFNNFFHDYLYRLGFDEPAGNYQSDNFGLGGAGNDPVNAEDQDGWPDCESTLIPNTNNANFLPTPDGQAGKMQMYVWTFVTPYRDGDFDRDVVLHEYAHGLTNRLVGGPASADSLGNHQGGSMGEGWSDFFPCSIADDDVVGEYAYGQAGGIRFAPYDTSPYTFGDLGQVYSGGCEVHADGEIWAAVLWKLRADYLLIHGPQGKEMFEQDVVDSLKITASSPSFLDARDAMVQAAIANGEDECLVWQIYASRGMGTDSSVAGNGCDAVTEGFAVPSGCECASPQLPGDVQALVNTGVGVDLTWQSQAASGALGYRVMRSASGCSGPFEPVGFTREPTLAYRDVPPAPGAYGYVIRAVPAMGTPCGADSACVPAEWGCVPGGPGVDANSVRVTRTGGDALISWLSRGVGRWNVHRAADPSVLGTLFQEPSSIVATTDTTQAVDTGVTGPGEIGFYQAYGADGCSGESVP